MIHYLVLSFIDVQGANAIAGFTWGFPAITQFLGFTHALERNWNDQFSEVYKIKALGCAVVANATEQRVFKNRQNLEFLQSKRTPTFDKDKSSSPPIIEEGKMNMTVSLIIEVEGNLPTRSTEIMDFEKKLIDLCYTMRLAGGVIQKINNLKLISSNIMTDQRKVLKTIKNLVMPGFVLKDRRDYLIEHYENLQKENEDVELLDAWLDFSALKYKAEKIEDNNSLKENKAQWSYIPKPNKGYLVPLMVGYKSISELYEAGEVEDVRDMEVPSRFVEAVHTIGEWLGAHRIQNIVEYIWRYQYLDDHWYLCQQEKTSLIVNTENQNDIFSDDEELSLEQAINLL